jgi:TonB family protein
MSKKSCRFFVLAFVLLAVGVCSPSDDRSVGPESLIAQARKVQEIWTEGTPPSSMRAEIQMLDAKGKVTPGQYRVTWSSPSRWREELQIAGYTRVRVHDEKGYWQQSTLNFQPEGIFQLDTLLELKIVLKVGGKQVLGKVKSREKGGVHQNCTDVKWPTITERILCFDDATGNLLSVEYPELEHQNPPDISRIEYSEFNKVGERRIPFEVRAIRGRTVVAAVKVLEIKQTTDENPSLFVAPKDSERWTQCDEMKTPELLNHVNPNYPPTARRNGEQGRVIFYAVIEEDGMLSHLTLIQRATPTLESAAAEALRQWRYKPAACGHIPIRLETSIPVDFSLGR